MVCRNALVGSGDVGRFGYWYGWCATASRNGPATELVDAAQERERRDLAAASGAGERPPVMTVAPESTAWIAADARAQERRCTRPGPAAAPRTATWFGSFQISQCARRAARSAPPPRARSRRTSAGSSRRALDPDSPGARPNPAPYVTTPTTRQAAAESRRARRGRCRPSRRRRAPVRCGPRRCDARSQPRAGGAMRSRSASTSAGDSRRTSSKPCANPARDAGDREAAALRRPEARWCVVGRGGRRRGGWCGRPGAGRVVSCRSRRR